MPSALKVTPDEGLATPEAVRFRLGRLREELRSNPANAKGLLKRVTALRMRLPDEVAAMAAENAPAAKPMKAAKATAAKLLPAVPVACLASKADIYEFSSPLRFR